MNETMIPMYPSKFHPTNGEINVDKKTAPVPMTSLIESSAVASNKEESYTLESFLL